MFALVKGKLVIACEEELGVGESLEESKTPNLEEKRELCKTCHMLELCPRCLEEGQKELS